MPGPMRRRSLRLSMVVLTGIMFFPSSPAQAACSTEENIFVRETGSGKTGTRNYIQIRDRDLNLSCSADAEAHSTAHVTNLARDKWAEVGWHEDFSPLGFHQFNVFWEVGIGDIVVGHLENGPAISCCNWSIFRVEAVVGTNLWKFYFDYAADGSWTQIGPSGGQDATFATGIAEGETARRGGTGTGAADDQKTLKYRITLEGVGIPGRTTFSTTTTFRTGITTA
ncbi:MAG: hypothetical protein LC808_02720 [Actinobacteria bacterium]|nr:hypothetical protein [Actinomycetota bacterium]